MFTEELILYYSIKELSSFACLGNKVNVLFVLEVFEEFQNVGMVECLKNHNLLFESIHVLDFLFGNLFDSSFLLGIPVLANGHNAICTCSNRLLGDLVNIFDLSFVLANERLLL